MTAIPTLTFNDGRRIPQLGLGTWQTPNADAARVVADAIACGYRHIDTAAIYHNEEGVGQGIAASGIARDQIFVTTKLWNADQGYDSALRALDQSLARLKLDAVDLYLIHWPCPAHGQALASWKALIQARRDGKAKSIGVSNFRAEDLERIIGETGVTPAVNQIELHPWLQQHALRAVHAQHGIVTESWSPLAQGGALLADATLARIAAGHHKTAAQIVLRWHLQSGLVVFPKSVHPERIRENLGALDFTLDEADMAAIAQLDTGKRVGPDPVVFG
ncbi:MAG: aldo/keto reductase [Burkholderiaceae bacterium]|jgi:2,5-diketo-D-gluconate reductase A|nr:aldo/keto reductase [Burkholderiaceae bacterium]